MEPTLCLYHTAIASQRCVCLVFSRHVLFIFLQVTIRPIPPAKFSADAPSFPLLTTHSKSKPNIDAAFLRQLRAILFRIAFPNFRSKETLLVILHSSFLVLRTVLSVAVAKLDGRIARDLVGLLPSVLPSSIR